MATFAPSPANPHHLNSPPDAPSPAAIASRGRRPALIPHHADLSLSLSAASAALSAASYSPAHDNKAGGLWIMPPSAPSPAIGGDSMEEDVRRDVFSWVNSPSNDGEAERYLRTTMPTLDTSYNPGRIVSCCRDGHETAPASPTTTGEEAIERQKRRLEEAGHVVGL